MPDGSPDSSAAALQSFVRVIRRRFWLIALCVVLVPASVVAYSLAQPKQYRASASLLFGQSDVTSLLEGTQTSTPTADDDRTAATNVSLAGLEAVAARTADRLGMRPGDVAQRVGVDPVSSSNLVDIDVTDASAVTAAAIANAYAEEFVALRQDAAAAAVRRAENAVHRRLGQIQARLAALARQAHGKRLGDRAAAERRALVDERGRLFQRAGDLRSMQPLISGDVQLVQRATPPSSPASPRPRRDAVIGVGLGLVLGLGLALIFEMLDRRVRDPDEVGELLDLSIVGTIPNSQALAQPPGPGGLPDAETRAFQMLRTSLRYYGERKLGSLVVTSPGPREGKTTVAWNLARVSAIAGERVLLLEADLRRPSLASRLHLPADPGMADVLSGDAPLDAVVDEVVVGIHANGVATPCTLDVVVAGRALGDVSSLIESERMDALITAAQERYDLVVIDTPPTSLVPDAIPLMARVGGVLIVARLGRTTRDAVRFVTTQLTRIGARAVGVVVNSITAQDSYYYGRSYGELDRESPGVPEGVAGRR
jgi:polysaccharide biosynthesis transport protein